MTVVTKIEWADSTFNPWEGCQKVGPGCDHCYAETRNARFAGGTAVNWGPGAPRRRTSAANWNEPRRWQAQAGAFFAEHGRRRRVFCASLADVFDNAVDQAWRDDLFDLIKATPDLDWLLLTKRIGNVGNMLPVPFSFEQHYPNVWLGATITSQAEADRDIPKLLALDATVRFLSMEPLLGPVDLTELQAPGELRVWVDGLRGTASALAGAGQLHHVNRVDWVIVGGESGPGARPMHPAWVRSLRDQCARAGVPFLFKQHGEWLATAFSDDEQTDVPAKRIEYIGRDGTLHDGADGIDFFGGDEQVALIGKKAAGRLLDGVEHNGFPEVRHA